MEPAQNHYVNHLTEVNATNQIVLTEDVFNERNVLVAKKGALVDKSFAKKIAKHKLFRPLDNSISVTTMLNQRSSFEVFVNRLDEMKILEVIRKSSLYQDALDSFHLITKYPMVNQKLTIMAERMPDIFAQGLLKSVITLSISQELQLSTTVKSNIFLANIIADVGWLHIDPEIVNKNGQHTAEESKMMQGHVVIATHFAEMVPKLPKSVARAVLEHHERPDGYGYPFAKVASQLSTEGQVLAIVDKLSTRYQKLVKHGPYSLAAIMSVLQLPSTADVSGIHKAITRVLKSFSFKFEPAFSNLEFSNVIQKCIEKHERLNLWFQEFSNIFVNHKSSMQDSDNFKPVALLKKLEHTVIAAGVLNYEHLAWLTQLPSKLNESDLLDIEEFSLLLDEVEYQCFFVMRTLASAKDELAIRFGGEELPDMYYQGLMQILETVDE